MKGSADRSWELPNRPWVMRMIWSELLFAHWAVEPDLLESKLPVGLTLDRHDGKAWIGVVPFLMSDVAPRCFPAVPKLSRFLELNVRTYVTCGGKPGVWFFSLDAENPIAVRIARATFNLPYMDAKMTLARDDESMITYRSERTHRGEQPALFDATYRPIDQPWNARPGTLEHWLTARYCLYSADRRGNVYRGEIDHEPWRLSHASCELRRCEMTESLRLTLIGEPHLLFAHPIKVKAWALKRCD
ncbi:MAG: hypothetical protein RI963_3185 [Planctomycetota bacterium]